MEVLEAWFLCLNLPAVWGKLSIVGKLFDEVLTSDTVDEYYVSVGGVSLEA
jgi:hypothetical protein